MITKNKFKKYELFEITTSFGTTPNCLITCITKESISVLPINYVIEHEESSIPMLRIKYEEILDCKKESKDILFYALDKEYKHVKAAIETIAKRNERKNSRKNKKHPIVS